MSGGTIRGNRAPEVRESAEEVIERAREKVVAALENIEPKSKTGREIDIPQAPENFGPPSADHERPIANGERTLESVAPGRFNPDKQPD
jgi:hypothetical protein